MFFCLFTIKVAVRENRFTLETHSCDDVRYSTLLRATHAKLNNHCKMRELWWQKAFLLFGVDGAGLQCATVDGNIDERQHFSNPHHISSLLDSRFTTNRASTRIVFAFALQQIAASRHGRICEMENDQV